MKIAVAFLGCALAAASVPAFAADAPCSKFAWPVDRELSYLHAIKGETASGATLGAPPLAVTLVLATGAKLPAPPSRPADPAGYAGFVTLTPLKPGDYLISLSGEAWTDAIVDGKAVASNAHSGDPACPGLRKSVRFTLGAAPVIVEISNAPTDRISVAVTPWYWGPAAP